MAEQRRRGAVAGWVALGLGVATAAGIAAERAVARRDRARPDPYADEPYGELTWKDVGPVRSFDGTELHVEEAGSGPTLVLSHGFSLDLRLWHHQFKDLTAEMRLVAYDHRGHGRSARAVNDDYSLEALARDLEAVIAATANGEPVIVAGHSMGGMTALTFCDVFPEQVGPQVAGLVLIDTTAADVMGGPARISLGRRAQATFQGLQEAAFRALVGRTDSLDRLRAHGSDLAYLGTRLMGFGRNPPPSQVAFVERMLAGTPTDTWVRLIPAMTALDVTPVLPDIDVPTLVIVGERDRLTPAGAAMRIASAIPGAELVEIPDAGHTPMLEAHERLNGLLRRFVSRVTSTAR